MKVLVTGGAGYVGSHTVKSLLDGGEEIVVLDNLSQGHPRAVSCPLIKADLRKLKEIEDGFLGNRFEAVIHFAASTLVGGSVENPALYFENNVLASLNLLRVMVKRGVKFFIFSSTSEVYGEAQFLPITEDHPLEPENPYGLSKLAVEKALPWYENAYGIKFVSLRYFNAAGAAPGGLLGEDHRPETHLIPNAIRGALGLAPFKFTCSKVDTPDGTTIRDYVHVMDLASVHFSALNHLREGGRSGFYNVGVGKGYSTKEVVEMVKKVTGVDFPTKIGRARRGEPAAKYASNEKIKKDFGWKPKYGLQEIIESAYLWHQSHPQGYSR